MFSLLSLKSVRFWTHTRLIGLLTLLLDQPFYMYYNGYIFDYSYKFEVRTFFDFLTFMTTFNMYSFAQINKTYNDTLYIVDVLWSLLCGDQPISSPSNLHRLHHLQVPWQEEVGNATPLVLRRRQRLPKHGARYASSVTPHRVYCFIYSDVY